MTNSQRQLALSLLGCLLIARFVFVPWQQAQDELQQQIQVSEKRLHKAKSLAAVESEVREKTQELEKQQQQLFAALPLVPSAEQAVQVTQQLLQSHFEMTGVTLALFNWQGNVAYSDNNVQRGRASLRLSAPLSVVIRSLSALQQQYPFLILSEWSSAEVPSDPSLIYEVYVSVDLLFKVGQS